MAADPKPTTPKPGQKPGGGTRPGNPSPNEEGAKPPKPNTPT
jgi:hypothetical protein